MITKMIHGDELHRFLHGVLTWRETGEGIIPLRFSEKQMQLYAQHTRYSVRSVSSAGIQCKCTTDAAALTLDANVFPGSSIDLYGFDLYVDGRLYAHTEGKISEKSAVTWSVQLPAGKKKLELYLPCLAGTCLKSLTFHDTDCTEPAVCYAERMLCMGDSITQGYTAHYPSLTYPAALARKTKSELVNQGIGGETFHPDLLDSPLPYLPTCIMIAYGTNDWKRKTLDALMNDVHSFLSKTATLWPAVPVKVMTPIWRADCEEAALNGLTFDEMRQLIATAAASYPNMTTISGEDLFVADESLMADGRVHPNDTGFELIAKNLERLSFVSES